MPKQTFDFNSKFADLEKIKKEDDAKEQGTMAAIASTIKISGNPFEDDDESKPQESMMPKEKKAAEKKKPEKPRAKSEPKPETDEEDEVLLKVDKLFSKKVKKPLVVVSFNLEEDVNHAIEKIAKKNNISKSNVVNEILKNVMF